MTRHLLLGSLVTASVMMMLAYPEAEQNGTSARSASAAKPYAPPKTPWGDPDIQGGYSNKDEAGVPLERPGNMAGRQLTDIDDSELADIVRERQQRAAARVNAPYVPLFPGDTGGGPEHWYENYGAKNSRAWMVVDPPEGTLPPQTPEAIKRQGRGGRGGGRVGDGIPGVGRADSYTDRSFYDRCITRGLPGSFMPTIYGNAYDITQAPGLVAIRYEMIHETRIIPLDNHSRTGHASHMGDARGHWEGDTLVVETTNFDPRTVYRNASPQAKVIERFKPTGPRIIEWSMTVDDPTTWTRPWTFAMRLTADPEQQLFEYACHEGNYAMRNLLSAARAEERAAGASAK
jgi:hypothetical protein